MRKRGIFALFLGLVIVVLVTDLVLALGIVPARVNLNFEAGAEHTIKYTVSGVSGETKNIALFTEGELGNYITLDKNSINPKTDDGVFYVTIKIPKELPPGKNTAYIGVTEELDEELIGGPIGTAVSIKGTFSVHVPYPGEFLEATLTGHDVNVDEPILFELATLSKGEMDLIMNPTIEIYSENDELLDVLEFKEREIKSQSRIDLQKTFDTLGYASGNYYAVAKVYYGNAGEVAESTYTFRIGSFSLEVTDYTKQIKVGGLRKFDIILESQWNDVIDGAYADIILKKDRYTKLPVFRTSPTDLQPWGSGTVSGYVDTSNVTLGEYEAQISISYFGRDKGQTVDFIGKVKIYEDEANYFFWIMLIGGIVIGIIFIIIIITIIFKHGKKK